MNVDEMIKQIQKALKHTGNMVAPEDSSSATRFKWNPAMNNSDLTGLFIETASLVDAETHVLKYDAEIITGRLRNLVEEKKVSSGVVFPDDIKPEDGEGTFWKNVFREIPGLEIWDTAKLQSLAREELREQLAEKDFAVTGCEFLLADAGAAGILSNSIPGRTGSLLPPHHLVIASSSQIYSCFSHYLETSGNVLKRKDPGALIIISGPSRTADIEKTLVKGVHGPVSLSYYIID